MFCVDAFDTNCGKGEHMDPFCNQSFSRACCRSDLSIVASNDNEVVAIVITHRYTFIESFKEKSSTPTMDFNRHKIKLSHNFFRWAPIEEHSKFVTFTYIGGTFGTMITYPICGVILTSLGWEVNTYNPLHCADFFTSKVCIILKQFLSVS